MTAMTAPGPGVPAEFDRVARSYDLLVSLNPGYRRHLALSAARLAPAPDARILDLCCGTGLSTAALRAAYPRATLVGLDAAAEMLAVARARPELQGVELVHGDAMDPRAAGVTGTFDGILMAYGIRNMPDPDTCLARARELLAPGAPICFHEYSVTGSRWARAVWRLVTTTVVIPLARILVGNAALFDYLRASVLAFDSVERFQQRLRDAGFTALRVLPMDGWQRSIVHSFLARRPPPAARDSAAAQRSAVVVGGGIAGVAAAVVLAERGVRTTTTRSSVPTAPGSRSPACPGVLPPTWWHSPGATPRSPWPRSAGCICAARCRCWPSTNGAPTAATMPSPPATIWTRCAFRRRRGACCSTCSRTRSSTRRTRCRPASCS